MTKPVTIQPGPAQRPTETPVVAPVPAPPPPTAPQPSPEVIRASLRYSIKDALAWSVMQGVGTSYLTPFIVLGGSGLLHLAAFSGLPGIANGVVQWLAANVTDVLHRRNRIIVSSSFVQALTWLPICLAIFLPLETGYWLMLAAFIAFGALANFAQPAWQSLMGDLVPADRRGRYFGLRNALSGAVQMTSFFAAGWWLTFCERHDRLAVVGLTSRNFGFLLLFGLAFCSRLLSVWYLSRVHEPTYCHQPSDRFTLLQFIRRAPKAHFGRFVFYCMLMNVGFGFVGPFLGWYLLDQLKFSPVAFAAVMSASLTAGVASQPLWGRLVDRLGSKHVLAIGGIGVVLIPVFLLLCRSFWHFMLAMVYDGVMAAAFSIAVGNYFYDVVTPPKRARCVAYNTLFVALGGAVGAFAGAALGELSPMPLNAAGLVIAQPFTLLLIASAALRLLANLLLLGTFEEFRLRQPVFQVAGESAG
jgi:MFS family permease